MEKICIIMYKTTPPLIRITLLALVFLISACNGSREKGNNEMEAIADTLQEASDQQLPKKTYGKRYTGKKLKENDSLLLAKKDAQSIVSMTHANGANRVFRKGFVLGDTVKFQLEEDIDNEGKLWAFDFSQTGGDFSELKYPQLVEGEKVTDVNRRYFFKNGSLFYAEDAIFTKRDNEKQIIHSNHYVFENGQLVGWYKGREKYLVEEKYHPIAQNLFPNVNGQPLLKWASETFADPATLINKLHLISADAPSRELAIEKMIAKIQDSISIIADGKEIGWPDGPEAVLWLNFNTSGIAKGAAIRFDLAQNQQSEVSLYDPSLIGIAYFAKDYCETLGDVLATIVYAKRSSDLYLAKSFVPRKGVLQADPSDTTFLQNNAVDTLKKEQFTLASIPNPLYHGSYKMDRFSNDSTASFKWWLPGSAEIMYFRKEGSEIYWTGFSGAYH